MNTSERKISFLTADGITIHGVLHLPDGAGSGNRVSAALLLHGAGHDCEAFASFVYPGMAQLLASQGVAALRIDWRGRGLSIGDREFHSFSDEQRSSISLDVRGALEFLSAQPEIDADRLAIFAEEISAEWAAAGSEGDPRVRAIALLSGRLSKEAQASLGKRKDAPVLCVVSKEDRRGFADMSAVFAASNHPESDFKLYEDMGRGTTMFTLWRYKYPDQKGVDFLSKMQGVDTEKIGLRPRDPGDEKPIENVICDWIGVRLRSLGRLREVTLETEDGWEIFGNLLTPDEAGDGKRVPGVVLLHSGWSDRHIFHRIERLFVKSGIAVLNIDWRGRGKSRGKGNFFTLPREERDRGHLDVKAAIEMLASQPEVDSSRMAVLGAYLGAKLAVGAALGDKRIRALVMLSGFIPSGAERESILNAHWPMLLIGSRGFAPVTNAMADLYEMTRDRGSELLVYDGGALGYQLFDYDEGLEQRIVNWVDQHTGESATGQSAEESDGES
ncbi:MAG: alpha/beta fold hydrolase [Acidobacteria bacterium]|nr:alpha/beta fold hydrolase [Acidobacteriota bacterium]